jgi:pimeloyl-ACP methyl ester carboxylesterase
MGGAISLLASGDPAVAGVATFSAYYHFTACFQRYLELSLPNISPETIDLVLGETARFGGFNVADVSPSAVVPAQSHRPPLLIQHGGGDILIPMNQARELAAAWGSTARLIEHPSAGHADILSRPEALLPFYEFVESLPC